MECKYLVYNYKHKEGCSELIDTLWNVNYESCEVDVIDFAN